MSHKKTKKDKTNGEKRVLVMYFRTRIGYGRYKLVLVTTHLSVYSNLGGRLAQSQDKITGTYSWFSPETSKLGHLTLGVYIYGFRTKFN